MLSIVLMVNGSVLAHSNLVRSEPSANAVLATPPAEIRLWFSEPLEPDFSSFTLRDSTGKTVKTPPTVVDANDPTQIVLSPGQLPDGLYTVIWEAVSATDGHRTQGNFPFTIGVAGATPQVTISSESAPIPADGAIVRWLNLISLSMAVGSIGFWLFVWQPANPLGQSIIEQRMSRLIWAGWLLIGLTGLLMLLLQTSLSSGTPLLGALGSPALGEVISATRYGTLWILRMAMWLALGMMLFLSRMDKRLYWLALGVGCGILLTNSLFSHASSAADTLAAVTGDWLHLAATTLWIGGLIQFINIIGLIKRTFFPATHTVGILVGYFSNYARACVAALILTGLYAAWLQVGSVEALLTTNYGQVLLVKLILFPPLLVIAGINLIFTSCGLSAGHELWVGRLRGLVGAEIALTVAILAAVGIMTSGEPARAISGQGVALPVKPNAIFQMQSSPELMAHLDIYPGYVGDNSFSLELYDVKANKQINDASLIRLRFKSQTESLGRSEIRPEKTVNDDYAITGSNLSIPGDWDITATIQRPGKFDTVLDFVVTVTPPPAPVIDRTISITSRFIASMLTGLALLMVGGFLIAQARPYWLRGAGLLAAVMLLSGLVFLISAAMIRG